MDSVLNRELSVFERLRAADFWGGGKANAGAAPSPTYQGPARGVCGTVILVSVSSVPQTARTTSAAVATEASREHEIPRLKVAGMERSACSACRPGSGSAGRLKGCH